jgi:glutaminyl-peptide cyclotransferase
MRIPPVSCLLLLPLVATMLGGCPQRPLPADVPRYGYRVVNTFPHDTGAWTQGLLWHDGRLYESTGEYGRSSVRHVALDTGEVLRQHNLADRFFGEGLALVEDRLIQLTWKSGVAFVYERDTFDTLRRFAYDGEGWGLTYDGEHLIMSDGSAELRFLDPATFQEQRRVTVRDSGGPVRRLNELEYIEGEVFANIWKREHLARIDPDTGNVTGWVDLTGLFPEEDRGPDVDVLNGIAYDPEANRLFVTGKHWPTVYEVELVPEPMEQAG